MLPRVYHNNYLIAAVCTCLVALITWSAKTATLPRLWVTIPSRCRRLPILQSLVQGSPQLVSNPSLRPEPVGPEGDRALRVLLRTDDLNLCGPLFDDIPGENGARLLDRAILTLFAQGLAPPWHESNYLKVEAHLWTSCAKLHYIFWLPLFGKLPWMVHL